jgi:uncharacterized lipoprotein YmbA
VSLPRLVPVLCLVLAACGRPAAPVTYHRLQALPPAGAGTPLDLAVTVGPARFPDLLDRPHLVLAQGGGAVTLSQTHRWAAPLAKDSLKVLAQDLGAALGSARVAAAGFDPPGAAPWRVSLDVFRFDGGLGGDLRLEVRWSLAAPDGRVAGQRLSAFTEPVHGQDVEALVAAHDRALADLGAELAEALREAAR